MALGLLQLCLTLLWALKTQATDSTTEETSGISPDKFRKKINFQAEKLQGEWNAVAWAMSTPRNESISNTHMLSTNFELKEDQSYIVTSIWYSDKTCTPKTDTFVKSTVPSRYIMKDPQRYQGLQNFTMQVIDTNYHEYAAVLYNATVDNKVYMECVLYARTREKNVDLLVYFIVMTRDMGFPPLNLYLTVKRFGCSVDYIE